MMEKKTYFMFVFEYEESSYLWCEFPDIVGCVAQGENLEDLMKNAADQLRGDLERLVNSGKDIPEATHDLATLREMAIESESMCESKISFIAMMTVHLSGAPARINVTSTTGKIDEITEFAKKIGKTRSELMVQATLDYIHSNA